MSIIPRRNMSYPVKNQLMSITYNGKTYGICEQGQLDYVLSVGKEDILSQAAMKKERLSEKELAKRLEEYRDNCGYATLEFVLAKMTPAEREQWAINYRFQPFTRNRK